MSAPTPSLGTTIRAARLGWGYAPRHGCFVRMEDVGDDHNRIELCPTNAIPSKKTPSRFHRCWWESPEVLDLIPWLANVRAVHRYVSVIVDSDGRILTAETK